jgi:ribosomal protein L6P/L9E
VDSFDKKSKKKSKAIRTWKTNRKLKARTRTIASHIKNMIHGVSKVKEIISL